jgi:hypothetical protein
MRVIVAGGRDYFFSLNDYNILDCLHEHFGFTEIVSGGANGADDGGEKWAEGKEMSVRVFPADWGKYGRAAGPMRNKQMAEYVASVGSSRKAGLCILFPGGAGTRNMYMAALEHGIQVLDLR